MSFNLKKMYQKSFAEKKVLKKEIEELKEENKKLKEEIMIECQSCDGTQHDHWFDEEKEEEKKKVEVCCECNREKKSLGDMFVHNRDLNGVDTVRCGMCALSFYEGKSRR